MLIIHLNSCESVTSMNLLQHLVLTTKGTLAYGVDMVQISFTLSLVNKYKRHTPGEHTINPGIAVLAVAHMPHCAEV